MPFQLTRVNADRGRTVTPPKTYNTRRQAFRSAVKREAQFRLDFWTSPGSDDGDADGPPITRTFKTYTRPRELEIELRYDYKIGSENHTNSIIWRVIEV